MSKKPMLENAYLDAKIGVDTAENEPSFFFLFPFFFRTSPLKNAAVVVGCSWKVCEAVVKSFGGLVLGCVEADFCKLEVCLKLFWVSDSTRFTHVCTFLH